ncbi:cysteine desulfurase family protein [Corynebacterium glyciniphilum]|uniref:cysteine desulfurase family protein n=1 Tax=Corynebacterium glyciniphilum TaxID=1404244 RepID=UPI00265194C5|nr:cysteine desulfurase family protein [Corynebacterium glyciniphilum]MDN5684172.1 cysteine desulfurase [Corynebacterium glyciniphilum]
MTPTTPRIFADHAATAPLRPEAAAAMADTGVLLNPAGQYASGRHAQRVLEDAREQVAELLGADRAEVIFTASGTESDNIAVQGLAYGAKKTRGPDARRIHAAATEHPAIVETVDWLCSGMVGGGTPQFDHIETPVDDKGRVRVSELPELEASVDAVMTCMWANNETGNLQPVVDLSGRAAAAGVPFHVDAVQAVGHLPVDFHALGSSTLAASAHKFGGPKSMGILLARRDAVLVSPLRGGGQERGVRSGTANPQGAAGTAAALAAAVSEMEEEQRRLSAFRRKVLSVVGTIPQSRVYTDPSGGALAGHVHVAFPGAEGDSLIMLLDVAGVDASTGSACSAGVNRASHVLMAMGVPVEVARGALRLTFGTATTAEEVDRLCSLLPGVVDQARAAGMAS